MLEKFLNLQRDYPIGTAVVIDADGMPEDDVVTGYGIYADVVYLETSDNGKINSVRVPEMIIRSRRNIP